MITGRIVSKIVITWTQGLLVLPQLSVAVQVRFIVELYGQEPFTLALVYANCVITLLQLSVAVALPVFVVAVSIVQVGLSYTVIGAGAGDHRSYRI